MSADLPEGSKRTTVLFRPKDLENVEVISAMLGGLSSTDVLRRALDTARLVMEHRAAGGEVVFERGDERTIVRFL